MIKMVEPHSKQDLITGAQIEPLVGAKILSFFDAYGLEHWNIASFWIIYNQENKVMGSILRAEGILNLSLHPDVNLTELFDFLSMIGGFFEVFLMGNLPLLQAISSHLNGFLYHCTAFTYAGTLNPANIQPQHNINPNLTAVFHCIKDASPHFGARIHYETWLTDTSYKVRHHLSYIIAMQQDDKIISTGGLYAIGTHHAILSSLATHLDYRKKGLATQIVTALIQKSLQLHKIPALFCGSDSLIPFYENLGFVACGIWGNITLTST